MDARLDRVSLVCRARHRLHVASESRVWRFVALRGQPIPDSAQIATEPSCRNALRRREPAAPPPLRQLAPASPAERTRAVPGAVPRNSCTLVCQDAASGILRLAAIHAPNIPKSPGPVMCTTSGLNPPSEYKSWTRLRA